MTAPATVLRKRNFKLRSAIEAALIMAIGMGFGRFAFTAVYPHMVDEGLLTLRGGSFAASANYGGYLLGALISVRARAGNAHRFCLWSVVGTTLCLVAMAFFTPLWAIIVVRGCAGVFSALSMVSASLWLLEYRKHFGGTPWLYAGVGVGIAVSAEILVIAAHAGLRSPTMWLVLAAVTLVIGLGAAPGIAARGSESLESASQGTASTAMPVSHWPLVGLYGLAGLGYIVTATYLPLLVKSALPDLDPAHVWAVFGLGAAPSCFLWHRLHGRWGTRTALRINLAVQAVGVVLPAFSASTVNCLLSALLVGGTFMGTVTIAMPAAQRAAGKAGINLLATMTLVYGLGQVIGPVLAQALYAQSHDFSRSLMAASAALILGILISMRL
ncbi:YbfB/YjiJ family MFS transporter [Robbsia sp. Bb-Pol-6]|uniref:YbfB/YjiJ family MFS transporter n=1 Tax=Robbsia betulipollinis TaxID=2981849 RepID=A0ABT3ZTT9_9BURK|nr:YbfB/YjiJ family MFS transporter [Robbsia betulipollinis]MCY0389330.1 YbfB/YjiJ family MFS transporter [Robbsia betulipollinis]